MAEAAYLIVVLAVTSWFLFVVARILSGEAPISVAKIFLGPTPAREILLWVIVALTGACGGAVSSLKWLYHSVARQVWHRDRIIWRIVVPILAGTLAPFTGMMISSGLLPFLNNTTLNNAIVCAGYGFFVGLFADNLMGGLQRFAHQVFGTLEGSKSTNAPGKASDEGGNGERW